MTLVLWIDDDDDFLFDIGIIIIIVVIVVGCDGRFNQRYGNLSTLGTLLTLLCRPYPDHLRTYSEASVK